MGYSECKFTLQWFRNLRHSNREENLEGSDEKPLGLKVKNFITFNYILNSLQK